jgi:biopolymer transport protein TolR
MRNIRSSRRQRLRVNAEISFTNLIDVAFVLLIIFMITAPIMQGGIELELPRADAAPLTSSDAVVVSVDRDGRIFLDEAEVGLDEFESIFNMYMSSHEGQPVSVKGDRDTRYEHVMQVMGMLMRLGITDVNMITDPVTRRR